MTVTTINGKDTIKRTETGVYRVHRAAMFWVGDYDDYKSAKRALQIANSAGAHKTQRGFYDGGVHASEEEHMQAYKNQKGLMFDVFGKENCVTQDDVNRTILAGEPCVIRGGFPVRAIV